VYEQVFAFVNHDRVGYLGRHAWPDRPGSRRHPPRADRRRDRLL